MSTLPETRARLHFRDALRFWLWLGFVSFGGPAGQIAIMHRELVERRRWISEKRFLHALNYCMALPGPEAQQLATYIGWLMHGVRGGIAAGALFVLPSLLILVALSWIYVRYGDVPAVAAVLNGVKPAVVAIVLAAAWRIGSRTLRHPLPWAIAGGAFVALALLHVAFPFVLLAAAAIGIVGVRAWPAALQGGRHATAAGKQLPALIDDDTPPPPHARFSRRTFLLTIAAFAAVWIAATLSLAHAFGVRSDFVQMALFFTQAAFLTFGGAYAVLPYVLQHAVETFGWVTASQVIDGLALGETTPGPLIMIVAFVGFVGGWTKAALGADALLVAAIIGASVATFYTFLPSFLFILAGGPLVERTRDDMKLAAPLTAITAAVVGVILNLAMIFAWRVFWPDATEAAPFSGRFDGAAVTIAILAGLALMARKTEVIPVVAASGAAGLLLWLAGYSAM